MAVGAAGSGADTAGPCPRHETAYGDYRNRYRTVAKSLKFDGHIARVDAMS
jgi:hypothetical protein